MRFSSIARGEVGVLGRGRDEAAKEAGKSSRWEKKREQNGL